MARVIRRAAATGSVPFKVMETTRSAAQQRINIKRGVSWTMKSKHLPGKDGLSLAVDIVPVDASGKEIWAWPVYYRLAPEIKAAARALGVAIKWGGDWKKHRDGPHWEL